MVNKSIKKNTIYNIIRRSMAVVFPLITYPYATRVLGAANIGKVNYIASIISYFTLIASFGATTYGAREGAIFRDSKEEFSKFASKVFSINILFTIVSYLVLFLFTSISSKLTSYTMLIILESITIATTALAADWINVVYEDYKYITVRSFFIYITTLSILFLFVKQPSDYYIYALMTVISNALICILNLGYCRKYAKLKIVNAFRYGSHIKNMFVFFANELTISIYVNIDTTMIGMIKGDYAVGIYSLSVKIYTIVKTIFAAIYSVTLSRLSYYFYNRKYIEYKNLLNNIISVLMLILIPGAVELCVLSPEVVRIIGGSGFSPSTGSLRILCIALIFAIFGGVVTNCINLPMNKEKINLYATIISATANIVLNIPFIYFLSERGAAITTVLSEFIVFIYCIIKNKKINNFLDRKGVLVNFLTGIIGSAIVVIIYLLGNKIINLIIVKIIFVVIISMLAYGGFLILTGNKTILSLLKKRK